MVIAHNIARFIGPIPQSKTYGRMTAPIQMHMGLAYLAAIAEQSKEEVEIIDMDAEGLRIDDFAARIKEKRRDIVGFTVTTPTFFSTIELAKRVKQHSPNTTVICGGMHPTIRPQEMISLDCVDIVVKGEGEITFRELLKSMESSRDFSTIKGIVYKKDGRIEETLPRPLVEDLDSLPFPARHLFKNRRYTYPDSLYKNTAPLITSRGCPGRCNFCTAHMIFHRVFRARSARNVVDEVELLTKKWGIREIHIWDDNFATLKNRVLEMRDEIVRRNLKVKFAFPNGIRADFLNGEVLEALKDMGTYSIAIGVESGNQEILDSSHKGERLEKIEEVFRLAKKMKLETWAFFMIGLPGDNKKTIQETIRFAKEIDPDIVKFHILKPYPGTEVYEYLNSKGCILTQDYNMFGIHTPPIHRLEGLSSKEMLEWQKRAYLDFYFRPQKIFKEILRVRTFNRFRLNFQAGLGVLKLVLSKNDE